jgi:hypothetical protein
MAVPTSTKTPKYRPEVLALRVMSTTTTRIIAGEMTTSVTKGDGEADKYFPGGGGGCGHGGG